MDKNEIKQIRHLLMCIVKDEHHVCCTLEVKDEQTRLSLHGWRQGRTDEQPSGYCLRRNAAEKWHPTRHDGMSEIDSPHVFQGPNYAWCAWKVAFVAFHTFLVEDSRIEQKSSWGQPFVFVHCYAIKNKIKNYGTDRVKKLWYCRR